MDRDNGAANADASRRAAPAARDRRPATELFLISFLLLFLELACIRWFPAHVLYLTFFTNVVLIAAFLGMSLGCLAARSARSYLRWTPLVLLAGMVAAHAIDYQRASLATVIAVESHDSPQEVFYGTDYQALDLAAFVVPIEVIGGAFFLVVALAFLGIGQELGRRLNRIDNRIAAYSLNIAGSMAGIAAFALCSIFELTPAVWFGVVALCLAYFFQRDLELRRSARLALMGSLAAIVMLGAITSLSGRIHETDRLVPREYHWSPYYRVDYETSPRRLGLWVNLLGHQRMFSHEHPRSPAYSFPHLLWRDSGGAPFRRVLVIGAGSGNDVSRALQWNAESVDAVEIDPVIQRLGARDHPDRPYSDPRVTVHLDDGRNYLRRATPDHRYDLIVYAFVDSLALHSGLANLRLESFLFTREAMADVRRLLAPDGVFVVYAYFNHGWLATRLHRTLVETFDSEPIVMSLPHQPELSEDSKPVFGMLITGHTEPLTAAFASGRSYWIESDVALGPATGNGFERQPPEPPAGALRLGPAVLRSSADLRVATDDWPFFYLRRPMIPLLSIKWAATMAILSALLLALFRPRDRETSGRIDPTMFFLGAGFMLIETKAVVHMSLLFGSTWIVNSVVFFSMLAMILVANLFVVRVRPRRVLPFYLLLFAALALNALVPLGSFLGGLAGLRLAGACLLVFAPILFAGVIFATRFAQAAAPDRALGANIAGTMVGGILEYASTLVGFRGLIVVAGALYAASTVAWRRGGSPR